MRRCGAVLVCAVALLAAACGGGGSRTPEPVQNAAFANTSALGRLNSAESNEAAALEPGRRCDPGSETRLRTRKTAFAGVVVKRAVAYSRPGGRRIKAFGMFNENDFPTVFGVLSAVVGPDCEPVWYRVQLPMRPNGATGYVRSRAIDLFRVSTRIEVDLSARRIEFFDKGRRVIEATAAIGSAITPTPTGSYYVNQRLTTRDAWGPFGPAAIGISAFSPVLQDWVQGGPIAIHGTNEPSTVGQAVSHGCLRLPNDTLVQLFDRTPAGTPVTIRA